MLWIFWPKFRLIGLCRAQTSRKTVLCHQRSVIVCPVLRRFSRCSLFCAHQEPILEILIEKFMDVAAYGFKEAERIQIFVQNLVNSGVCGNSIWVSQSAHRNITDRGVSLLAYCFFCVSWHVLLWNNHFLLWLLQDIYSYRPSQLQYFWVWRYNLKVFCWSRQI